MPSVVKFVLLVSAVMTLVLIAVMEAVSLAETIALVVIVEVDVTMANLVPGSSGSGTSCDCSEVA